ncbi:MAG: NAD(P)/FAD-dependent oxidoreductase, partial [Acetobacteraceae bacterium]
MARIGVIGGGIVGLACAHALAADGHGVTVLDRDPEGDKCSWENAGGIGVSEVIPAASLAVLARVPRYLLDPLGPLAIRPAHLPALLPWLAGFVASARPARVARAAAALAALTTRAHDDLVPLLAAIGLSDALTRTGALTVYRSRAAFDGEAAEWGLRGRLGVAWQALSGTDVRTLEPALGPAVACGVLVPGWSQVRDPRAIWAALLAALHARGVAVRRAEVVALDADAHVRTADGAQHAFEAVVVAAGAWSAPLAHNLGDRVLLASERGYNTTIAEPGAFLTREVI